MSKLDPRLQQRLLTARAESDTDTVLRGQRVGVIVVFTDDLEALMQHGLNVESEAAKIAVGTVDLADVEALAALDDVVYVKMERNLRLSILNSVPEIGADTVHTIFPTSYTGKGVIVGVIDSGIDFRHHAFRKPDGKTRILAIWDQNLSAEPGESKPALFSPGVEYTQAFIDSALDGSGPPVRQKDTIGHGTHVAGIAAGDGSQSGTSEKGANCHGEDTYVGVAPEADLVIVKTTLKDKDLISAVSYIFQKAGSRPAVINMSLGGDIGPHDGTDPVDTHIDKQLALADNRAVVVAAGNDGDKGLHASKNVPANGTVTFTFTVPPGDKKGDVIDLWYGGNARLEVTLQAPTPATIGPVLPGAQTGLKPLGSDTVSIFSVLNNPFNAKHEIVFIIAQPTKQVAAGDWVITLQETAGHNTTVDCWIVLEREDSYPAFVEADRVQQGSVDEPGTAEGVITVGAYDPDNGALADFSSRGPTIDGRTKPEITAPGVGIEAARSGERSVWYCCDCCQDFYVVDEGTSMAAPHVAGTVALMFERNPNVSFNIIKAFIAGTARFPEQEEPPPTLPNNDWGFGKIDTLEAVLTVPAANGGGGGGGGGGPGVLINPNTRFMAPFRSPPRSIRVRLHELQQTILATPAGHLITALISTHFDEVYRLINTNRRVATTWHRSGGPVLVRLLLTRNVDGDHPLPETIGDRPLVGELERLLAILSHYGSLTLRGDIDRYGPLIAAAPGKRLTELDYSKVLS